MNCKLFNHHLSLIIIPFLGYVRHHAMTNNKEIPRDVLSYNTVVTDIQKKQNGKKIHLTKKKITWSVLADCE